jgi:hypothetical protein
LDELSLPAMLDIQDPENRKIRFILITAGVSAVLALCFAAVVIAVMISYNFNFLQWME